MGDYEQKYYMYVPKSQDADFHNNIIIVVAIPSIILPQRLIILHSDPVAWFEISFTCTCMREGRKIANINKESRGEETSTVINGAMWE